MGEKLLGSLPVNEITSITIKSNEGTVFLGKGKSIWVVENRFNYPADFSMITDLVKKLKGIKIGRNFKATTDTISRLALMSPDQKAKIKDPQGTRIILKDGEDKILTDIIFGKARESSSGAGGQYVMPANTSTIYLVDKSFTHIDKKPAEWLNRDLIGIEPNAIEKVVCSKLGSEKIIYTLKRPDKDKPPVFINVPLNKGKKDKKIIKTKLDQVFEALSSLGIEDIADPEQNGENIRIKDAQCLKYYLFNGMTYKICLGKPLDNDKDKFYFRAKVEFAPLLQKTKVNGENGPKDQKKLSEEADRLYKKLNPWIYVISKWEHDRFVTDPKDFFEKEKTE